MKVGIIGLPSTGKTSVFNALTRSTAETGGYGRGKDVNLGVIPVPDPRFNWLVEHYHPRKVTPAAIEFVDGMGGQDLAQARASGLGTDFYAAVRSAEALVDVVRAFEDPAVPAPEGGVNPLRDFRAVTSELLLADLDLVEKRVERLEKTLRAGKSKVLDAAAQLDLLRRIGESLEAERPVRDQGLSADESQMLRELQFLTALPLLVVANVGESDLGPEPPAALAPLQEYAQANGYPLVPLCAKVEMEVAQLDAEEEGEFLSAMGIQESGRDRLVRLAYRELGLIYFFTAGEDEVRAWTIRQGQTAVEAAGKIHTDLARGFIRAEVVAFDKLQAAGNWSAAKDQGFFRLEGKEYRVHDGDVMNIRFNV